MYYNENNRDGGLWGVRAPGGRINRIFHGLDYDPDHVVVAVPAEDSDGEEEDDQENDDDGEQTGPTGGTITPPSPTPEPEEWVKSLCQSSPTCEG